MKKIIILCLLSIVISSCKKTLKDDNRERILKTSVGRTNMILTVTKAGFWDGIIGNEIRRIFGQHQVGLPQPETLVSMTQVDPVGFKGSMTMYKAVLQVQIGQVEGVTVEHDRYASPQVIVHVVAKDEIRLRQILVDKASVIIDVFKNEDLKHLQSIFTKNKLDEQQFNTVKDLGVKLIIPSTYRLVKDSIGFLWLRQHLKSGISRGDGTNNILLYSVDYNDYNSLKDSVSSIRNKIGKIHIPGNKQGMYMVTEEAYMPHVFDTEIASCRSIETRGKWEVTGDFMAGPFVNFMIFDKPKNRVLVFEGFTYAPSVNKRDFIFELEAIGRSIRFD